MLASWIELLLGLLNRAQLGDYLQVMLARIAACEVANRPGRLEPRVLKRRRHRYKLMMRPRYELHHELRKRCT